MVLPIIERLRSLMSSEAGKLVRFVLIGGLSAFIYFLAYAFFSRFVWPEWNKTLLNFFAIALSAVFNFFAHRWYTFRSQGRKRKEIPRYLFVLVTSAIIQSLLFWLGHEFLHLHDLLVAFLVPAIIPLYTYAMHRLFTFRHPTVVDASVS
jgi:putative flippase GtrA